MARASQKRSGGHALILGCGASGAACARFLAARGWSLTVSDTRPEPPLAAALADEIKGIGWRLGGIEAADAERCDLLAISPGLSPDGPEAGPAVAAARRRGVAVVGEIELFGRELERLAAERDHRPVALAVTGSNGKTTTVSLLGAMARAAGRRAIVAGNIGPSALTELDRALTAGRLPECWILELSSFQLATTDSLRLSAAAYLNLSPDHLDWHGGLAAYGQAKERILRLARARVINRDDPATARGLPRDGGLTLSFGLGAPAGPGQWGLSEDAGLSWLSFIPPDAAGDGERAPILLMPAEAPLIRGRHNTANALAALALAHAAGWELAPCLRALAEYRGEPHRVQPVLSVAGVEFIDDSKGTNVGATSAALRGLCQGERRSAVILGGDGKGQDFGALAPVVAECARAVALIGRDGPAIGAALAATGVPLREFGADLAAAVRWAFSQARPGDRVLLSPACASWDMFHDYAERAERFVALARDLAAEREGEGRS